MSNEWKGVASALYDEGYMDGVIDAYNYVTDELGLDISDSDLLKRHGIHTVKELNDARRSN